MIDPVIDEHFRRSLGADYMHLFEKRSPPIIESESIATPRSSPKSRLASPIARTKSPASTAASVTITPIIDARPAQHKQTINVEMSVDDHFAKALGDTWKKLQEADRILPSPSSVCSTGTSKGGDYDDDDDDADSTSS